MAETWRTDHGAQKAAESLASLAEYRREVAVPILPGRCRCGRHVALFREPLRWADPETGEPCQHR